LGQCSPSLMLASMSASDYNRFKRWFAKIGFKFEMDNWRMGQVCASVWNVALKPENHLKPTQFYTFEQPVASEQSDDDLMELGAAIPGGFRFDKPSSEFDGQA